MANEPTILVTGAAGRIGQAVVRELKARGRRVRSFDRVPAANADESIVGSITDADTVRKAVAGIGTLIHLAATPDDEDFLTQLLPNNVVGVFHILEEAGKAGVRRLVLASSGQVVWWQRDIGPFPIGVDVQPTPRGWYAATKLFLEAAGRAWAEPPGRSVIAVRLGWCPRPGQAKELAATDWGPDVYLSPGDVGRFYGCIVDTPNTPKFAVVYACSKPLRKLLYDPTPARDLFGYEPRDTWPQGAEDMLRG